MKDLAILIPVYNDSTALVDTLDSIQEEDNSFTVVVVDDGSETPVQVPESRYPFVIRLLRMEKNGGIIAALNHGLAHICEEGFRLVARLDAADFNRPHRFSIQYRHLKENPSLALLGSNVVFRDEQNGEPLFTTNLPLRPESTRRWIELRTAFIHPAVMMRTEVVRGL
ncbi:MAG: glycosyltransferase, partial [Verrucomicrobiota bacterium]